MMDTSQLLDVFATCAACGEQSSVSVDLATWQEWMKSGEDDDDGNPTPTINVQDAFPDMTPANREVLIGNKAGWHLCNVCWADL
tara:strand:+ start:3552 stop:3803 length:252 start_codon:yes stop_codon:yes gene_type:complete